MVVVQLMSTASSALLLLPCTASRCPARNPAFARDTRCIIYDEKFWDERGARFARNLGHQCYRPAGEAATTSASLVVAAGTVLASMPASWMKSTALTAICVSLTPTVLQYSRNSLAEYRRAWTMVQTRWRRERQRPAKRIMGLYSPIGVVRAILLF